MAQVSRSTPAEIEFEVSPDPSASCLESTLAEPLAALVRRTCKIARALTHAEQAAIQLWVNDSSHAHKHFSLGAEYADFGGFRVDPRGTGLHGMKIPPGEVVRLTQAEVLSHPLFHGFAPFSDVHPPMRGWLATSVCGQDGRHYGLLQLSDKAFGLDFDESDEANIAELAALLGSMIDALRLAADPTDQRSALAPTRMRPRPRGAILAPSETEPLRREKS